MDRLAQLEAAMLEVDRGQTQGGERVVVAAGAGRDLDVAGLEVRLPNGEPMASVPTLKLAPGERALITGPSGTGKSTLFRALTGLWPLGSGHISLPMRADVLSMPQRPYFPLGTLRQAIAYPLPVEAVSDAQMREAMAAVGLGHLAARLDEEAEWSEVLSGGEQQRVAFARALLRRPAVLLFDEPVSTLTDASARELYQMLLRRLPDAIVVAIDRRGVLRDLHPHVIEFNGLAAREQREHAGLTPAPA